MSEEVRINSSEEPFLKVSSGSNSHQVAAAIAHAIYDNKTAKVRAIGASAVNQATKAIAIARGLVAPRGLDLISIPGFATVESRDGEISAMVFTVTIR